MQQRQVSGALDAAVPVPKQQEQNVVATRAGEVLIKHSLLKSDHFPGDRMRCIELSGFVKALKSCAAGCQNRNLLPLLEGAPNYRQACLACDLSSALHPLTRAGCCTGARAAGLWRGYPHCCRHTPCPGGHRAQRRYSTQGTHISLCGSTL